MLNDLLIVGAGNAAREILQFVKDVNRVVPTWNLRGFLADIPSRINELTRGEYDVVGTIQGWQPKASERFLCAVADPKGREQVVQVLQSKGALFTSLIHPSVSIHDYCTVGEGVILYPYCSIGANAVLGNFVFVQKTDIAHDARIGAFSTVSSLCGILGGVEIGKRVFIGCNATLIPGIRVGDDAYVGAGSVVIRHVRPGSKVFGNPAQRIDW